MNKYTSLKLSKWLQDNGFEGESEISVDNYRWYAIMEITVETKEDKTVVPIFSPIRATNIKRNDPIDKLEKWTEKELKEILEDEIKKWNHKKQ